MHRLLAGNPAIQVIEVLAGAPLERMAAAEHVADRGELVADNETVRLLDSRAAVGVWRRGEDGLPVAVLSRLVRPRTAPHFDAPPAPSYDLPDADRAAVATAGSLGQPGGRRRALPGRVAPGHRTLRALYRARF